jgi:hypothetical protein
VRHFLAEGLGTGEVRPILRRAQLFRRKRDNGLDVEHEAMGGQSPLANPVPPEWVSSDYSWQASIRRDFEAETQGTRATTIIEPIEEAP